jgi:long-chain acyl-CoA synthetase
VSAAAPLTMPGLLAATVERAADRTALVSGDRRLSWADVAADVERRAAGLAARDVGPGDAVALVLPNDVEFVTTFMAVLHLGAVAVPLNPAFTVTELGRHLAGTGAKGIVATAELVPPIQQWADHTLAGRGLWVAGAAAIPAAAGTPAPPVAARPDGAALHGFSSGSTGTPKGIVRTQANLVHEADNFYDTVGIGEDDVILSVVALFHAHGLGNCVQAAVRSGAGMVLVDQFRRDAVLAAIADERVTMFPSVPFICHTLAETRRAERADTRSLRLCFTAGAPLARATYDLFTARFGLPLRQLYGCSEAGSVTINLDDDTDGLAGSVGRPIKGIDLAVVGEGDEPKAPGESGEITFASNAAATGYVGGEPDAERPAFAGGWFRTGDLGHVDRAGNLYVTGRSKLFIATSGYKVDPVEVEDVLRQHPAVADVVVLGSHGSLGEEVVKAVVVEGPDGGDNRQLRRELLALCREQLAVHKVPRIVEFRAEIPRSPLGKILRKYLV